MRQVREELRQVEREGRVGGKHTGNMTDTFQNKTGNEMENKMSCVCL